MINQLLLAILLTIAPISELRGGMPVAIDYARNAGISLLPIITLIILANVSIIFLIFLFLDEFHENLMKFKFYKRVFGAYLKKTQKKIDEFEEKYEKSGFLALMIFVAVPLPGTGAWTGTIIAWLLGLERKKSILAIAFGVAIAGIIVALATLGIINIFNWI